MTIVDGSNSPRTALAMNMVKLTNATSNENTAEINNALLVAANTPGNTSSMATPLARVLIVTERRRILIILFISLLSTRR